MIEQFDNVRYNWEEQSKKYLEISKRLPKEDKQLLLKELLEKDLWSYFKLITEILFDIASDDKDYIELLEKVYLKVKNDMASSPFFDMLIDLGQKKKDIGIKIYDKIQRRSNNEELKEILGFILGGYSINNNTILGKLTEDKILVYPDTITILKAIMVKCERTNKIFKEEYEFLDFVSQSDDERFLRELMNVYRFLYQINEAYFYKKIKDLMSKKKSSINSMIWIFREKLKLSNAQLLELAELTKDCDEHAIGELMSTLTHNKLEYSSQDIKQISELFIYWINRDLEFKVRFFDYSLEELSKKNIGFLEYFLDNYKNIGVIGKESLNYNFLFPRIFEKLIRNRIEEDVISKLLEKDIKDKNPKLFYKLSERIIGEIYKIPDKEKGFRLFLSLAIKIQTMAEKIAFINDNKNSFARLIKTKNFDKLIDYIKDLLEQLIFKKVDFNFDEIEGNLSEFKKLKDATKNKLKSLKNKKKYSPLFWLGSQERDKELKVAYLQEIENFLELSEGISNERCGDNQVSIISSLGDESSFWDTFSEIIMTNKFLLKKENYNPIIEPIIPNKEKNADLSIELNKKKTYFEIRNSKGDRNLHLDNGGVSIKNKLDKIIKDKSSQLFDEKTFEEMESGEKKDLFFIAVDTSSSTIDEYDIANSFFGSLAVQFYRNDKTGETTESQTIRNNDAITRKKRIITGLIHFKRQLVNMDGEIKFILVGDIIQNPHAINKMSSNEYKKLKKIIFN